MDKKNAERVVCKNKLKCKIAFPLALSDHIAMHKCIYVCLL